MKDEHATQYADVGTRVCVLYVYDRVEWAYAYALMYACVCVRRVLSAHVLLTASHSLRSSLCGNITAARMLPLPKVDLAVSDSFSDLWSLCGLTCLKVFFLKMLAMSK